jgi:hypothetical protein
MKVDYWKRTPEVAEAKEKHLSKISDVCSLESHIMTSVLYDCDVDLEKNLFPYNCPAGIEHWTLWSKVDMKHAEICLFVERYCLRNLPDVVEWNYEDNSHRSIDIPHVHVFFRKHTPGELDAATTPEAIEKDSDAGHWRCDEGEEDADLVQWRAVPPALPDGCDAAVSASSSPSLIDDDLGNEVCADIGAPPKKRHLSPASVSEEGEDEREVGGDGSGGRWPECDASEDEDAPPAQKRRRADSDSCERHRIGC